MDGGLGGHDASRKHQTRACKARASDCELDAQLEWEALELIELSPLSLSLSLQSDFNCMSCQHVLGVDVIEHPLQTFTFAASL